MQAGLEGGCGPAKGEVDDVAALVVLGLDCFPGASGLGGGFEVVNREQRQPGRDDDAAGGVEGVGVLGGLGESAEGVGLEGGCGGGCGSGEEFVLGGVGDAESCAECLDGGEHGVKAVGGPRVGPAPGKVRRVR